MEESNVNKSIKLLNATDIFVEYIMKLKQKPLPEKVSEKTKECLLDFVGVTYAGACVNKERMQKVLSGDAGRCDVLGYNIKTVSREAAFINALNAHTAELDDGSRFGMIHLGAGIIPAVIAAAQEKELPYNSVIEGIIVGYEAAVRVSLAMQPGHKKRGFHTSGTCGLIGAAVGVACAMDCDRKQLKAVVSAAATSAAGLLEIQEDASTLKPYNLGHAAMAGLNAAYVGMAGFIGPEDILNGSRGMLRLLSDNQSVDKLATETDYYEIEQIYVKPYAACRHCHSAIEAILRLRDGFHIPTEDIIKIQIQTYEMAVRGHEHHNIYGIASAKLSMPFSVAAAYVLGTAGMEAFTEQTISNQTIIGLMSKVEVVVDPDMTVQAKSKRIAEVHIVTEAREESFRVDYAKGDPENPLSRDELIQKFELLMEWSGRSQESMEIKRNIFVDYIKHSEKPKIYNS